MNFKLFLLLALLSVNISVGQTTGIKGRLVDIQGAVITGTEITATDKERRIFRTTTNIEGEYLFALPSGEYTLEIRKNRSLFCPLLVKDYVVPKLNGVVAFDIMLKHSTSSHGGPKCKMKTIEF